ncbi:MAG: DUF4412 domain-containing protein [Nibricoccus sp.]
MKIIVPFLRVASACLLVAALATQASAFEGKIDMKNTVGKDSTPMTFFVKGPLMRMEMKASGGKRKGGEETAVMLLNTETQEATMLMEKDKMYMVLKMPKDQIEQAQKDNAMEFKATGRKEKIAGVDAEEYIGTSKKQYVEIWVTKELGKFMMANPGGPMGGKKKTDPWQVFAEKENFFPLRTITRAKEGAPEESRMEVTAIDKSKQADSLFKPPADYQKFEMPNMGDMMRGMGPGR